MAVGRKRLTIFGLRPKYTSRIVTVLTGIIIVSLTMTSLLLISDSVRQSLFGLEELQATVSNLSRQVASLEKRQQSLTKDNLTLHAENEALARQREELEAAIEERIFDIYESGNEYFQRLVARLGLYENLLVTNLVYEGNELIASYVIDVPSTRSELAAEVRDILEKTNVRVLAAGAGEVTEGWALMMEEVIEDADGVTFVTQDQHIDMLVESIWTTPGLTSVVVQVIAKTHTFEGWPVELDFRLFVNSQVFYEGQTVTARVFDGRETGPSLLNQVWSWLEVDIRQAARDRGLLGNPDGTVTGAIEPGTLFEVVEHIRAAKGPIRVHAVAAADVSTSDELPLRFEYDSL